MAIPRYTDSIIDKQRLNTRLQQKSVEAVNELVQEMAKLGMKHSGGDNLKAIKLGYRKQDEMINRIRFRFKRSGVFVHKGVGRGTKISQVGSTNREPKEWFNPVIEKVADELAEIAADEFVEITMNRLKIN